MAYLYNVFLILHINIVYFIFYVLCVIFFSDNLDKPKNDLFFAQILRLLGDFDEIFILRCFFAQMDEMLILFGLHLSKRLVIVKIFILLGYFDEISRVRSLYSAIWTKS